MTSSTSTSAPPRQQPRDTPVAGPGRAPADAAARAARNPVGTHVPVAGGLATRGLAYAREAGAEAVQVFVANPRGWATPAGSPGQDEAFRAACAVESVPVFVHAPYLINFGSHTEATAERSVESLRHSLRRGRAIGARGVVVHTGSATGGTAPERALAQVRELVLPLLDELEHDDDPWLLLEPTAGQGSSLCSRMEHLGPYVEALEAHPRLGVCLDTCHAFAAGHDLASPGGMKQALDTLVATVGTGRLKLVHVNDSQAPSGSHLDRHANVGDGMIGREPFRELFTHPATQGVPLAIETPGGKEGHTRDIAVLKQLRDGLST